MNLLSLPFVHRLGNAAPVVVRLVVGVIMAWHGWQKLTVGPAGFGGFLDSLGVPAPTFTAWVVTFVELGGGLLLVLGLLSRIAAAALTLVLVGAIALVKVDVGLIAPQGQGAGAELDLALIAGFLVVLLLGPGRPSLDHALGIEDAVPALVERPREPAAT